MPDSPEAREAEAKARVAELDVEQKEREAAEWTSDLARRHRQAEHVSGIAKAGQETSDAGALRFLPDLAGLDRGETKIDGEQAIYGTKLALEAICSAAAGVAGKVPQDARSVLVTTQQDLVTADAVHQEIQARLTELSGAAATALGQPRLTESAADAITGLVTPLISLLSAHRNASTYAIGKDDLVTTANVIGKLLGRDGLVVQHDDLRLLPDAQIIKDFTKLYSAGQRLALGNEAQKALAENIDTYLTSITNVPEGATRSMLTTAALHEQVRNHEVDYVLFVRPDGGSVVQLLNDRPLWLKDKLFVHATMSVTYLLFKTASRRIVAAGTESADAKIVRKVGDEL